ncbi:MAG: FAD-dependent oxidoreductase [Acidobacteria bacterium]|nr:FAD-dependent oxidoreductase [Acidobacteriota bacterium]
MRRSKKKSVEKSVEGKPALSRLKATLLPRQISLPSKEPSSQLKPTTVDLNKISPGAKESSPSKLENPLLDSPPLPISPSPLLPSASLTRRELLAAFLGLPVALAACSATKTPSLPQGEIVGASNDTGHRLRDGQHVEVAADHWQRVKVVIVGGGVAGLAAARKLLQAGVDDFVLLELEREAGGTARSGTSPLVAYPWGAHYLPAPMKENVALVGLLEEMGLLEGKDQDGEPIVAEQFLCRDPEERIFFKGRWYEGLYLRAGATSDDLAQFDRFNNEVKKLVAWRDAKGRRAFALPIANSSDDAEINQLDRLTMGEWLNRHSLTSPRLRWLVDYACRDDYGMTVEQTSAWAGLFYFCSRVKKPGDDAEPLITFPEGNGRLVNYLFDKAKAKARLGFAAAEIIPIETNGRAGVDVIAVSHDGETSRGFHAERVIFAAPHFLSRFVIRDYRDQPPAHVAEFEYGAWLVANLFLRDRPKDKGFPLCWDNVFYDSDSLGYVVATHQRGIDRGATVFTYYYPLCDEDPKQARQRLLDKDWAQLADVVLTDMSRAHTEIRSLVERLDVMRWGHAMIRPRPNFVRSAARREAAKAYRNIHFAHTDLSGVALFEEAFYHGNRAAEEIVGGKQ